MEELAPQTDALGVIAELRGRRHTPHPCAKHADTFPALCTFFCLMSQDVVCAASAACCDVCLSVVLFGGRWGDSLLLLTSPPPPRDCFTFGDTFEGCCQIIIGKSGGGMFFLPSRLQARESHHAAAEGSWQHIHGSAGTGALSAPASVCAALAEDDAVSAEPATSM